MLGSKNQGANFKNRGVEGKTSLLGFAVDFKLSCWDFEVRVQVRTFPIVPTMSPYLLLRSRITK